MNKEREKAILEILSKERKVLVKDLAKRLYASQPSIRRDLISLENRKLLRRIHGGAILEENCNSTQKIPFVIREYEQADKKIFIAKKASEYVSDGDVIFMDASSSVYNMLPFLENKKDITVVTNSLKIINTLSESHVKCISTGGTLMPSCMVFVGDDAVRTVSYYHADKFFFSCRGISESGELTDISSEEIRVRLSMLERCDLSYLLCVSDKFNKTYTHKLCDKDRVTAIITEEEVL